MSGSGKHDRPDRLSQLFQVCFTLVLEKNYFMEFQFEARHEYIKFENMFYKLHSKSCNYPVRMEMSW